MRKAWWWAIVIGLVLASCGTAGYTRLDPGGDYTYSNPVWSPDSKQIAYTRCEIYDQTKGKKLPSCELLVMDVAARQAKQLTRNEVYDGQPTWSPDGTQLAYRREEAASSVIDSLRVIDIAGTHDREIYVCPTPCNTPAWSPHGARLAFQMVTSSAADSASAVFLIRADGGDVQQLTTADRVVWKPSWSLDGAQIVFHQDGDQPLGLVDVATGQNTTLSVKEARGPDEPIFARDGSGLVFSGYGEAAGKRLFLLRFGEDVAHPLLLTEADYPPDMQEPDWSPDGKFIVFSAYHEKLYLADVEQTRQK